MTGGQVMVVLIVLIVMVASIVKSRQGPSGGRGHEGESRVKSAETERLREEVKALKERLAVIERITVEKENSLDREIERLRDQ